LVIDSDYKHLFDKIDKGIAKIYICNSTVLNILTPIIAEMKTLNERIEALLLEVIETDDDLSMELMAMQDALNHLEIDYTNLNKPNSNY
jgi:hypothetical protein